MVRSSLVLAQTTMTPNTITVTAASVATVVPPRPDVDYPCWTGNVGLMKQGVSGNNVKELQSLLAQDKTIYPEGLVTGYFGSLTKEAVKKLERKLGLSQTGEINENSRPFIYPCYDLKVVYPNGGESFQVGEIMKISWEVSMPTYKLIKSTTTNQMMTKVIPRGSTDPDAARIMPMIAKQMLSIDLYNEEPFQRCMIELTVGRKCPPAEKVVYHIQNVLLENGNGVVNWQIPTSILESKNYKIRISSFVGPPCPPGAFCAMNFIPSWEVSDSSDGVFSILGGQPQPTPTTSVTPLPTATPQPDLIKIRNEVTEMIKKLQEILEKLNALLGLS